MIIVTSSFSKSSVSKSFPSRRKRAAGVFKFLRFEKRFRKAPFSRRIRVDGRPDRRNKAAFSNFFSEVWTLPLLWYHQGAYMYFCRPGITVYARVTLEFVWR